MMDIKGIEDCVEGLGVEGMEGMMERTKKMRRMSE